MQVIDKLVCIKYTSTRADIDITNNISRYQRISEID